MGPAALLVIEERPDGVFLFRYAGDGNCAGDTWHLSIEDAKYQAEFEYADDAMGWNVIPDSINDVVQFGLGYL